MKEGSEPADHENNRKKAKKTAGSKTSTTTKKERELKELLAMEAQSDQTMTEVTAGMGKDPTGWSWARDFIMPTRLSARTSWSCTPIMNSSGRLR